MGLLDSIKQLLTKNKKDANIYATTFKKTYGENEPLEIGLYSGTTPLANKKVTIDINGKKYEKKTNYNGIAKLDINLGVGTYNALLTFNEDNTYYQDTAYVQVYVNPKIETSDLIMIQGDGSRFRAKLKDVNDEPITNSNVIFNINGLDYTKTTDNEGEASLAINLPVGTYGIQTKVNDIIQTNTININEPPVTENSQINDTSTSNIPNVDDKITPTNRNLDNNNHFGYWVFGRDMYNVNLDDFKNHNVTDVFLNYYAFEAHGDDAVKQWIKQASNKGINIHIWMQVFYDGEWHNPVEMDLNPRINEAKGYAAIDGVAGVHLDYFRYPGNAYKTEGGADAITNFARQMREAIPNVILSCAVMPETDDKYYYGQDIDELGKIMDIIIPMQYTGNYGAGESWLASTSQLFSSKARVWAGLQSYKSDDDATPLSEEQLQKDMRTCLTNGTKGAILFRYGLSPNVNFPLVLNSDEILSTRIEGSDVNMSYKDGSQYSCAVYDNNNRRVYGEVTMIINGASYVKTADSDGFYKININLPAGTYPIHVQYAGDNNHEGSTTQNTIVVNGVNKGTTRMEGTNVNMTYRDGTQYQCAIYNELNQRIYDKVIININNVDYTREADGEGLYKLNLNLPVGNYKIKATFPGNNIYNPSMVENDIVINEEKREEPVELYDYFTNQGGGYLGQRTGYTCGPHSLMQCIHRLTGEDVSEMELASVAGTTSDGTDHEGLETALDWFNRTYGYNLKMEWKNFSEVGFEGTQQAIDNGACFHHILYRNEWGHYEVPKWTNGDPIYVLNSLGDSCGDGYCGYIEERSRSEHQEYINGISQKSVCIITR